MERWEEHLVKLRLSIALLMEGALTFIGSKPSVKRVFTFLPVLLSDKGAKRSFI